MTINKLKADLIYFLAKSASIRAMKENARNQIIEIYQQIGKAESELRDLIQVFDIEPGLYEIHGTIIRCTKAEATQLEIVGSISSENHL